MDWRIYRSIFDFSLHHHWLGTLFSWIETASIPFMVVATVGLWLLSRPGGDGKWKRAATAGLGSAALALGVNKVISTWLWTRPRPYITHHLNDPWSHKTDASFPSDHSSATFAIAFAVLAFDPLGGAVFLVLALVISIGRLVIGAHYPSDVGTGFLIGLASALVVTRLLRPAVGWLVRQVERLTDPVLAPLWRLTTK